MSSISVVIPTYNRADLIGETLDAVLAQTLPPDEVIVVDDGSQDATAAIVAGFGSRIRCIRIENSGDMVARNVGVRAARGDLVAFCDSDDLWMPGFTAAMARQWQAEPKLLACYADFRILQDGALSAATKFEQAPDSFWSGLRMTGPDAGVFDAGVIERLLQFQPFFPSCMMVARAAFLEAGGWDEGVSRIVGCDLATALRVAALPPLGVVRQPLAAIRKHGGNISGNTERMALGDARVLDHVLQTRPELAPLEPLIHASIASRRCAALDLAFGRRDFATVRDIRRQLPARLMPAKLRIKSAIAALPPPLNGIAARLVSR